MVQTWQYGTTGEKSLLADGTGSDFAADPSSYDTYSGDFTWSSDGTSFFVENDTPDVFGISENCRVLQLGDLMYTGDRKASCPFDPVALNSQEKALVGKWRFFDSSSDSLSLFGFELQGDRYGKGPDSFYSATVTVVGTWYVDGSTLSIASPVGDHTLQITFQETPGDWAKAIAVYEGQNHWGYIRTSTF